MKVSKDMYEDELQSSFGAGKMLGFLVSRNWGLKVFDLVMGTLKGQKIKGVTCEEHYLPSTSDPGHRIRVRVYRPEKAKGRIPAMLYLHGGGYMVGVPEQAASFYKGILERREVAIIAPAYRLSVKHPFPAGFNDCYDTLLWMKENSEALNIYSDNYIIAGHSAGGGLTAALSLKARDTQDVKIGFQMPIYPMIDHRMQTESSKMSGAPVWETQNSRFGWDHYLKGLGKQAVPAYASPALNEDYAGFPPTISFVGGLEPFRDESIAYMDALKAAGVPTMFKIFEKAYHGFEVLAPKTKLGKEADQFQLDGFTEYYDRYVKK